MEIKVNNTKQLNYAFNTWKKSEIKDIYKAYGRPSVNKIEAWNDCCKLMKKYNGEELKIIGVSTCSFSCGFVFNHNGVNYFCFITKDHTRFMKIR